VKVLVTGGAGFIGSNLARDLVQRGDEVRILDNFSTGNRTNLAELTNEVEVIGSSVPE
jgi:UDP-glucose 4-epimerase